LQITQAHVAALAWQTVGDAQELALGDFHSLTLPNPPSRVN
jgi:hypothetical protein